MVIIKWPRDRNNVISLQRVTTGLGLCTGGWGHEAGGGCLRTYVLWPSSACPVMLCVCMFACEPARATRLQPTSHSQAHECRGFSARERPGPGKTGPDERVCCVLKRSWTVPAPPYLSRTLWKLCGAEHVFSTRGAVLSDGTDSLRKPRDGSLEDSP